MNEDKIKKIIETSMIGEKMRGSNGAVMVDDEADEIVYLLVNEISPPQFREKLEDMLSEEANDYMFVVHKTKEAMHISKLPRR